jgi:hypothetical protein
MIDVAPAPQFQQIGRNALFIGIAAALLCIVGAFFSRAQFFQSWLVAWLFFTGLSLGSLVIVMIQALTGGAWGWAIRPLCEAAMLALPLMAALFIPVLIGAHDLFPWSQAQALAAHAKWQHKRAYLNLPFFALRGFFYFAVLSALAISIRRASHKWIPRLSGGGLVLYVLCMNFASTDWVMSLEPDWYSTIFVIIFIASQFLSALALMTALLSLHGSRDDAALETRHFHDLGNMLLAFVIFWIYVSFSQFLIIWSGNLPKEISWYLHRSAGGWKWVALFLMAFQFLVPFALLLSRAAKRKRERLGAIAAVIVVANVVNVYWFVAPSFHAEGIYLHWLDFAALIAVGGIWTGTFCWILKKQPLLPLPVVEVPRHA